MSLGDVGLLALACLAVFLPGLALLRLGLGRGWVESLAAAPAVSVAVCYITAVLTAGVHLPWGPVTVAICTVLLTGLGLLARTRWTWLATTRQADTERRLWVVPVAGVLLSALLGLYEFVRGLGNLSVLPQEHDMVEQTLVVARITRTHQAAPWQSSPIDLLSGRPGGFYPNGVHMLAALGAPGPSHSVAALNAVTVVLVALVLPISMAAFASLLSPAAIRPTASAAAALISVVAYRPEFAFLHDGGVLANGAALALAPGVIYAAIKAARGGRSGALLTVALGLVGATVVHPTAAPTIGITAIVWIVAMLLLRRDRRAAVRAVVSLAVASVVAVVVLLPFLITGATAASFVTEFPRDTPQTALGGAFSMTLSFYYGGFFDPTGQRAQLVLALLSLAGVLICLYLRRNIPLLAAYAVWWAILLLWLTVPTMPGVGTLGTVYYSSFIRLNSAFSLLQWLTASVTLGAAAAVVTAIARRLARRVTWEPGALARRWAAPAVGLLVLLLFLGSVVHYPGVNVLTLQQRYRAPQFVRVNDDDLAAGRFLAKNVQTGQRVMNNANDGSTYDYIFYDVPLVEAYTLGTFRAQYTTDLLMSFDQLQDDAHIRGLVCDLDIAWVVADSRAPSIGAAPSVTPLGTNGLYTTPPGFRNLGELPELTRVFRQGHVTVYRIDRSQLNCGGGTA